MAAVAPQLRMMFNNPQFREMLSNPERLRQIFQMAGQMRAAGFDPTNPASMPFGLLGPGAFGAGAGAGAGSTTAESPTGAAGSTGTTTTGTQPQNLFAQAATGGANPATGTGSTPAVNPWASLFAADMPGAGGGGTTTGGGVGSPASPNAAANPFGSMVDPNLMQQMLGGFGGGWPGLGATPSAPADSRSPEERFQVQLQVGPLFPAVARQTLTDCVDVDFGTATTRYGLFKCLAKCQGSSCNRRQCSRSDRIHSWWWRVVVVPHTSTTYHITDALRSSSCVVICSRACIRNHV